LEKEIYQKYMQKLLNLSEKISKYLIAAVLIIVPLLPKFPLIKVTGTYVAIRFEDVLMLLLAVILIPKFLVDFKKIWKDRILASILIFFAITFISLLAGAFITQTIELRLGLLHWARRIEYMVPFLAAYLLIPKDKIRESAEFFFKVLLIVIALLFGYGMGEKYFNFPVIITQNQDYSKGIALFWTPGSHINSTFAGHYDLSAFVVLVMPILLAALFSVKGIFTKIILALSSGMGLWLLINSISRTAQATYLFAVTITLILLRKYKAWVAVAIISLISMFMSSGLDARFTQAIKYLYQRISGAGGVSYVSSGFTVRAADETVTLEANPMPTPMSTPVPQTGVNDVSIAIRTNVEWPRAIRAFLKNPMLGTGYSSIDLATDNDYLRMLGETGILGALAFALIILSMGKVYLKVFKLKDKLDDFEKSYLFGILGGAAGIFATAILIDLFEASKLAIVFWLLLGSSVNLIKSKVNEQ